MIYLKLLKSKNTQLLRVLLVFIFAAFFTACEMSEADEKSFTEIDLPFLEEVKIQDTKIEFRQIKLDLGDVYDTSSSSGFFTFINIGAKPARIKRVLSGCKCTVPSYPRFDIPAGDSARIYVEFTPAKLEQRRPSVQKREVTITGNFGEAIVLALYAKVIPADMKN